MLNPWCCSKETTALPFACSIFYAHSQITLMVDLSWVDCNNTILMTNFDGMSLWFSKIMYASLKSQGCARWMNIFFSKQFVTFMQPSIAQMAMTFWRHVSEVQCHFIYTIMVWISWILNVTHMIMYADLPIWLHKSCSLPLGIVFPYEVKYIYNTSSTYLLIQDYHH